MSSNFNILTVLTIVCVVLLIAVILLIKLSHRFERLYKKGMEALDAKKYDKAKKIFKEIAVKHPVCQESLHRLGIISFYLGEYQEAEDYFKQASKNREHCHMDLYNTALCKEMRGEYDLAKQLYKQTINMKADDIDAIYNLGLIDFKKENYQESLESFLKADALKPGDPLILYYIAKCQDALNDSKDLTLQKQITKLYDKLMNEKGLPADYMITVAYSYAKLGELKKTLIVLDKALEAQPENAKCYKLSALTDLVQLKREQAHSNVLIAIELDSSDVEAKKILEYINLLY